MAAKLQNTAHAAITSVKQNHTINWLDFYLSWRFLSGLIKTAGSQIGSHHITLWTKLQTTACHMASFFDQS